MRRDALDEDVREALRESQTFFSDKAEAYRASATHANRADLDRMISWLAPAPAARALDVATGGGHTARALVDAGCHVCALDATRAMLADVPSPVQGAAERLPFRDGAFDIVTSRIAPHHFADLDAFVAGSARVLRAGGALYVFDLTTPDDDSLGARIDHIERLRDPSHVRSHPPRVWREALRRAGLRVERFEQTASRFDIEPWLARARMPPAREAEARRLLAAHDARAWGGYGLVEPGIMQVLRVELLARRP